MKVINDAGHGGRDPGGGNSKYWNEKDIVLKIAHYCNTRFNELGIESGMTREKDVYLSARERTDIVKKSGARICISHHINAAENINAKGAETIHSIFSNGRLANIMMEELMAEGAAKRRVFCRPGNKDPKQDFYFMHRMTGAVETIIVEYGFGTNAEDVEKINDNWKNYAEATVRAVCKYSNILYESPKKEIEEVPWKYEALEYLNSVKVLDDVEGWKSKIDEPMPVWAVAILLKKIHENLKEGK